MIILYHQNNAVTQVWNDSVGEDVPVRLASIAATLFDVARTFPESLVFWCHESQRNNFNKENVSKIFHHKKIMAFYNPAKENYFPESIGYVDESLFANPKRDAKYATWFASAAIGGLSCEVLLSLEKETVVDTDFDYFLHSLAKLWMPHGLLCYSEPRLLLHTDAGYKTPKASTATVFRFVRQHYKFRWLFLLRLNHVLYQKSGHSRGFFQSLFYSKRKTDGKALDTIVVQSSKQLINEATVDVIIPTIGREQYLYTFLSDLAVQTHLPRKVIIVEQNPVEGSQSNLDYLQNNSWPFAISHTFTHQAGACNARNIALSQIESEWVFFADDDIRVGEDFLKAAFSQVAKYGNETNTLSCLQVNEKTVFDTVFQWKTFGSGCSIVKANTVKDLQFDRRFEFGFGEDADFGMHLRSKGYDVLYLPFPQILHLKAPIGGFRTKPELAWKHEKLQPKPSPTVMLYRLLHQSKTQLQGYKTVSFFKFYKHQSIRNPFRYYKNFKAKWAVSLFWANKIKNS